ncbi:MAG: GAF domain-containing protein [Chloroflexi bacterium]|nr:GAF domain-containing protein [Chloroflexota bacterium]
MSQDTQTLRHLQSENVRLRSENNSLKDYIGRLQRAIKALTGLQQKLDSIGPETNVYRLINEILAAALDAVDSENGSLLLLDEESGELVFVEVIGEARESLMHYHLPSGVGVAGWVVENRQPKLVEDVRLDPQFSSMVDKLTGLKTASLICVPLLDGKRVIGAIEVINTPTNRPFNTADRDVMLLVARLAAIAIDLAEDSQV